MIKISKLADYGTVVMHFLASHEGACYSVSAIAEQTGLASPTVSKVLKLLHEAELVGSTRGVNGGYQLSRSAENVSLADIITAIDGRPAVTDCSGMEKTCVVDNICQLRSNWQFINSIILKLLAGFSLADMAKPLTQQCYLPVEIQGLLHERTK